MEKDKLNLGCGLTSKEGYISIDINPALKPDVVHDCSIPPMPFKDKRFVEIYAESVLEHLLVSNQCGDPTTSDAWLENKYIDILKDWLRILKPGGVLKVKVPDFTGLVSLYHKEVVVAKDTRRQIPIIRVMHGGQDRNINQTHKFGFDKDLLSEWFRKAGFEKIKTEEEFLWNWAPLFWIEGRRPK